MKYLNGILSRSHHGYTKLVKPSLRNSRFQKIIFASNYYFEQSTNYAPYALLPATLLYLHSNIPVLSTILVAVIIVLLLGVLYKSQDMLLYHPNMPETAQIYVALPPPSIPYDEVEITTADGVILRGYFLKQKENMKDVATFVCFHGNAGNCGSPSVLKLYQNHGVNILVIDYRGYGRSSGTPSEQGLYIDGEASLQYLHSRTDIDLAKIIVHGHSLGGAVAIHLSGACQWAKGRIAAVIVENTFVNIPATAEHLFGRFVPGLGHLPTWAFKNKFDSISKVGDIQVPILFIYGSKDMVVTPTMSMSLYEQAKNPRSAIVEIADGQHNDTWCVSPLYSYAIGRFLQMVFDESLSDVSGSSEERVSSSWKWQNFVSGKI